MTKFLNYHLYSGFHNEGNNLLALTCLLRTGCWSPSKRSFIPSYFASSPIHFPSKSNTKAPISFHYLNIIKTSNLRNNGPFSCKLYRHLSLIYYTVRWYPNECQFECNWRICFSAKLLSSTPLFTYQTHMTPWFTLIYSTCNFLIKQSTFLHSEWLSMLISIVIVFILCTI